MAPPENQLGIAIKTARKEKKLSQAELAERLGISLPYLRDLEDYRRNPSYKMFERIVRYLDLSADAIIQPEKKHPDGAYLEMKHIFDLCDAGQRQMILALARTILNMSEHTELPRTRQNH